MDCGSSKISETTTKVEVRIRAYDETIDLRRADELEKQCEAGPGGGASLFTDLLGDPLCRVRQYPAFAMLVAETQPDMEIVGLVRAGVKEVICASEHASRVSHSSEGSPCKSEQSMTSDMGTPLDHDDHQAPLFVRIAYILGLRVAPKCRRLGIGAELVKKMEEWCKDRRAKFVYIATEKDNEASVGLFTKKLGYVEFRNPAILVQPVYVRGKKLSKKVQVVELSTEEACKLYSNLSLFGRSEFFPKDIESVVKSKLHKGTWLALRKHKNGDGRGGEARLQPNVSEGLGASLGCLISARGGGPKEASGDGGHERCVHRSHGVLDSSDVYNPAYYNKEEEISHRTGCESDERLNKLNNVGLNPRHPTISFPVLSSSSWAVLSMWKCNEIYQLEMKGASRCTRGVAAASRAVGRMLSWLVSIPTMPDVFKPFGLQLIYGLHAQGPGGPSLAHHLCWLAHNLAKEDKCTVVAAEVASNDPLRSFIPHWKCDEDMWCIKQLGTSDPTLGTMDWSKAPLTPSLFLDPRDF
ncbi:hypothetical protein GOP47_0002568 [Adiantum capillus-veneris]|uniref:N-acetyltransferase domain-containing protein n=1 Tax=Adiantum capillus-veneris TaxID=13818 RepID=A0A9D4ZRR4_ADICA|nr:hypothetical protein GOP47_0002568 [Adiantum capillus-veneris]